MICIFLTHKLAIEIDEKGHKDRDKYKEIERENSIKKNILTVNLLELILVKKILMCTFKLIKYTITLLNHPKNL